MDNEKRETPKYTGSIQGCTYQIQKFQVEDEVVDSGPIGCIYNLPIKKMEVITNPTQ